ncbi:MGMT family protein [Spirochaeta isovalerica]|uniref:Methylated-DNA-protein-cysteine methyltransferase-like protein n=1 Tax=Spirochaeta isovalerica TaxID=150 RepID=A0A841R6E6_9SPIO|nr:MGMT family protein [Spirochaeta isovalerica]MBB6478620.1 methylated-DNA-protein-cysteine methyltransferase-like protein [Spirochaeta isovalerica]
MNEFTEKVIRIISSIPEGKVVSYGQIAALAGNNRAARQVSWILRSSSGKYNLPWHRVVNGKGIISLPEHDGGNLQRELLENEGVEFRLNGAVSREFFWNGST